MSPKTIIVMGPSAAGKGTQITRMLEGPFSGEDVVYIATGDLVRKFKEGSSLAAKISREIDDKKMRQPDYLAIVLWGNAIIEKMRTGKEHLILDGFPRSLPEAIMVDTMIRLHFSRKDPMVINLRASDEVTFDRMVNIRRRADDTPEGARTRLSWFKKDVVPAIEFFRQNEGYLFFDVNGEQNKDKVTKDINEILSIF